MTASPLSAYVTRAVQEKVCRFCEARYTRRPRESSFVFERRVYCSNQCKHRSMWSRSLPPSDHPASNPDGSVFTQPWMDALQGQRPSAQKEQPRG